MSRFKKKEEGDRRTVRVPIRFTEQEAQKVKNLAEIRQMDLSEFMRRAALGRKADVRYEAEIVLSICDLTRSIRALHATFIEVGQMPPEAELLDLINQAKEAMLRISK